MKLRLLWFIIFLGIAASCAPVGEAVVYIDVIGNVTNDSGGLLKQWSLLSVTNPSYANGVLVSPSSVEVTINSVKVKGEISNWIDLPLSTLYPQNVVLYFSLVNGAGISADDYRSILIEYQSDWKVEYDFNSATYRGTNTSYSSNYTLLLSVAESLTNLTNSQPELTNASIGILPNSLTVFDGDTVYLYLYFDTINMVEVLTNSSGTRTNHVLHYPTVTIEEQ